MVRSLAGDEDAGKVPPRQTTAKLSEAVAFGSHVRKARLAREWSQERLAEAANINTVQLSHLENGGNEPKLRTILKLAKALGIRPGELIDAIKVRS
jgi:transcriptional regulator with XRE-family HTH domain